MAKRFLTDIDLLAFALLNAKMHPVSSDPSGLGANDAGRMWFNTTTKRTKTWDGTQAVDLIDLTFAAGTLLASKISDFATAVQALRWATMLAPNAPVDGGGQRYTNLAAPTTGTDAATRQYIDDALAALSSGQVIKGSVRVAAASNVSLASPGASIDGVALSAGDVVLLTGQTTPSQNGPYVWSAAASALVRATNWDTSAEAVLGSYWIVREGTYADQFALLSNDSPITLGTTAPAFVFRGSANVSYTGGDGLVLVGNDFRVGSGDGIIADPDSVRVDPARVKRKYRGTIPTTSSTVDGISITISGSTVTFNHGKSNLLAQLYLAYGSAGPIVGQPLEHDGAPADANNITLVLPSAPTLNMYEFEIDV